MKHNLGSRAGKATVEWDNKERIEISCYYSNDAEIPDVIIRLFKEEMDELVKWWVEQKQTS